ncbi:MAG: hypothetical protein ACPL7K_08520 [Armatimonadota bacterium]|uniref:hypothetical protein n=1 Tax=Thermogutta sp. TaxID=1962930 RepID=UPI00321FDF0B
MLNQILVTGKVASPLRRIDRETYLFILATFGPDGNLCFPPVIVHNPPDFLRFAPDCKLHEQPTVTVIGSIRTNNLSIPLKDEIVRLARRAGAPGKIVLRLQAVLSKSDDLYAKRVGVEIIADQIFPGGEWK